jgi:hypothetical protein
LSSASYVSVIFSPAAKRAKDMRRQSRARSRGGNWEMKGSGVSSTERLKVREEGCVGAADGKEEVTIWAMAAGSGKEGAGAEEAEEEAEEVVEEDEEEEQSESESSSTSEPDSSPSSSPSSSCPPACPPACIAAAAAMASTGPILAASPGARAAAAATASERGVGR